MKRLHSYSLFIYIALFLLFLAFPSSTYSQKIWLPTNSLDSFPVFCMTSIDDHLYVGMSKAGIHKTKDEGITWTTCNTGLGEVSPTQIIQNGKYLFAATLYHGVFVSEDLGSSWSKTDTTIHQQVNALAIQDNWVFAGTNAGLYRSNDNGQTWERVKHPYTSRLQRPIYSLSVVNDRLLAGSRKFVYWTKDYGENWTSVNTGARGDIRVALNTGTDLYLGSSADGVFKTSLSNVAESDGDFQPLLDLTPDLNNIKALLFTDNSLHIAALTKGINMGDALQNTGLPTTLIGSLVEHQGKLYAGTYWDGVWKFDISAIPPLKIKSPTVFGIFPNPTNAQEVTLSYQLEEAQDITISVLDNTGQQIQTIHKLHQNSGNYQEKILLNNLLPGTYYCTLKTKNGSQTKKLILVKR